MDYYKKLYRGFFLWTKKNEIFSLNMQIVCMKKAGRQFSRQRRIKMSFSSLAFVMTDTCYAGCFLHTKNF